MMLGGRKVGLSLVARRPVEVDSDPMGRHAVVYLHLPVRHFGVYIEKWLVGECVQWFDVGRV